MKDKARAALDTVVAFKLVYFRTSCYFFIPAGLLFLTQTETWSQSTWDALGAFLKGRLFLACILAGLNSICAYIDSSYQRARERGQEMKEERARESDTEIRRKLSEPGPIP